MEQYIIDVKQNDLYCHNLVLVMVQQQLIIGQRRGCQSEPQWTERISRRLGGAIVAHVKPKSNSLNTGTAMKLQEICVLSLCLHILTKITHIQL